MDNQNWSFIVIVIALALIATFAMVHYRTLAEERKDFIAKQYSFSEDECVTWNIFETCGKSGRESCVGYNIARPYPTFQECSLYCRNLTVPDVEDCKTIEDWEYDVTIVNVYNKENTLETWVTVSGSKNLVNRTVCTPKFRVVGQQCATAEQIQKAKKFVKLRNE